MQIFNYYHVSIIIIITSSSNDNNNDNTNNIKLKMLILIIMLQRYSWNHSRFLMLTGFYISEEIQYFFQSI